MVQCVIDDGVDKPSNFPDFRLEDIEDQERIFKWKDTDYLRIFATYLLLSWFAYWNISEIFGENIVCSTYVL